MFDNLMGLVRGDIRRQIDWAKREAHKQTRFAALTAGLAAAAGLAALGAIVVGLIALYTWLEARFDALIALAIVGGGLALLAAILFAAAFSRSRPKPAPLPALQSAHPAALVGAIKRDTLGEAAASAERLAASLKDGRLGEAARAAERLVSGLKAGSYREAVAAGEEAYRAAEDNLRHGSRPTIYATLAVAVLAGLIVGRRL
jgi:Zn-dependent protease with chaperone function